MGPADGPFASLHDFCTAAFPAGRWSTWSTHTVHNAFFSSSRVVLATASVRHAAQPIALTSVIADIREAAFWVIAAKRLKRYGGSDCYSKGENEG